MWSRYHPENTKAEKEKVEEEPKDIEKEFLIKGNSENIEAEEEKVEEEPKDIKEEKENVEDVNELVEGGRKRKRWQRIERRKRINGN